MVSDYRWLTLLPRPFITTVKLDPDYVIGTKNCFLEFVCVNDRPCIWEFGSREIIVIIPKVTAKVTTLPFSFAKGHVPGQCRFQLRFYIIPFEGTLGCFSLALLLADKHII